MNNTPGSTKSASIELGFANLSASMGDHIGHFFQTQDEWRAVLIPFLRQGLEDGQKCVYVLSAEHPREEIERSLAAEGIDVPKVLASRQLVLDTGRTTKDAMREWMLRELSDAQANFGLLRWGGDMTWSLKSMPSSRTLMEWESVCNCVEDAPVVFLCQYDLTQFRGDVVMDALKTHPLCIVGSVIHENPLYVSPESFLAELDRPASEVSN